MPKHAPYSVWVKDRYILHSKVHICEDDKVPLVRQPPYVGLRARAGPLPTIIPHLCIAAALATKHRHFRPGIGNRTLPQIATVFNKNLDVQRSSVFKPPIALGGHPNERRLTQKGHWLLMDKSKATPHTTLVKPSPSWYPKPLSGAGTWPQIVNHRACHMTHHIPRRTHSHLGFVLCIQVVCKNRTLGVCGERSRVGGDF
jgi:hypothetical protein